MDISRWVGVGVAILSMSVLGACAASPSAVGSKSPTPAAAAPTSASATAFQDTSSDATESAEPSASPSDEVATFNQTVSYEDGAEVEVTKIKHGTVSRSDAECDDNLDAGNDYVELSVKASNKGTKSLTDVYSYAELTFGPDGDQADSVYLCSSSRNNLDISGTIRPGKSKIALIRYAVPKKYQDDVQLEFDLGGGHDTAVFAGSVRS